MSTRKRSNSVKEALDQLEPTVVAERPVSSLNDEAKGASASNNVKAPGASSTAPLAPRSPLISWLVKPFQSLSIIAVTVSTWAVLEYATALSGPSNPLSPLLFISYPLTPNATELASTNPHPRYGKGPHDLSFLLFYIVVFSFLRQSITEFLIRPFARSLGIKSESKLMRFMEQAYAIVYFSASGGYGLYVMSGQKSWWYQTEHYWLEFPHWRMEGALKSYYLLQFSYWCQQMLVLILGLEKPRSDFKELVVHHIVTLWLVGWSYMINLTMIGTAIFVSMDLPDICLALSKCLNYLDLQHTSEVSFVFFLCVWHYMRHYLNIRILFSVWNEYDLIPEIYRTWSAPESNPARWWLFYGFGTGELPHWMKYQIFAPILALQLVNTFWSYLIWRILWRMIRGIPAADTREEGEDGEDEEDEKPKTVESKKKR
ncbi:TLC domain-domain-containing protein [Leucosporidium creatinivorum]|uniref:TLC domain-domain-containing protein n=1 Tax=Leucosporidium creatinivorum TaxID=106004 RepID=A0A1Y2D645_9BASI|nr:TLC domain-domain-containing protein [Leucosporidium creatinivorum]